ncbi:hypothetical protein NCPPB1935_09980 [Xanthomonas campestris pv. nigromaculans]|nr:hypothetical protein NCPPB1935_09980 [Xanthomonas campestris pv. nigromaculans]
MNHLRPVAIGLLAAALFTACKPAPPAAETAAAATPAPTGEQAAKAFDALLDKQWQYQLQHNPEFASIIGDKRYNDRWSDYSLEAVQAERTATAGLLKQFEAIDSKALDEQRQLSLQMMLGQLRDKLEGIDLKTYAMPLEPIGGIQLGLAGYGDAFPFENAKDYQDYIKRLQTIPTVIDQVIALSRQGAKEGLVQPRYLLERLPEQIDKIAALTGEQSPFASPLKNSTSPCRPTSATRCANNYSLRSSNRYARPTASWPRSCATNTPHKGARRKVCGRCPMASVAIATRSIPRPPPTWHRRRSIRSA